MTVTSGILQPILRSVQKGTLATGPITVAVGTTYYSPNITTDGYNYAAIWPASVSGGTGNPNRRQYGWDGTLLGVDNASSGNAPAGMADENYATFYTPPIFNQINFSWTNNDASNATVLGNINYTLTT